jgi:hypothetical protein
MHVHPILSDYIIRHNSEFQDNQTKVLDYNQTILKESGLS